MSSFAKWGLIWLGIAAVFACFGTFHLNNRPQLILWPGGRDEMFIRTAAGQQILVNGGEGKHLLQALDKVVPWRKKKLDLVILTSWRKDYLEGLINILKYYRVKNVLWLGAVNSDPVFQDWSELLRRKKINSLIAQEGQKIYFGSWVLEVVRPKKNFHRYQLKTEKNIIWKLKAGPRNFLFLGRASSSELADLSDEEIKADIVEVNENQKDPPALFWERINPSMVMVSGGWPRTKKFPFPYRQTQKEGRLVINF